MNFLAILFLKFFKISQLTTIFSCTFLVFFHEHFEGFHFFTGTVFFSWMEQEFSRGKTTLPLGVPSSFPNKPIMLSLPKNVYQGQRLHFFRVIDSKIQSCLKKCIRLFLEVISNKKLILLREGGWWDQTNLRYLDRVY